MMRAVSQAKTLLIILLSFFVLSVKGQVYQSMPQYGYSGPRFNMDSTLSIPTVCGVPTLKSNLIKKAAIAFDSCNNAFYHYNPKTLTWSKISIDTSNFLNINTLLFEDPIYSEFNSPYLTIKSKEAGLIDNGYLTNTNFLKFTNKVDTIYRTAGKDSIIFNINGRRRAIKDSVGGGGSRAVDTIYRTAGKDSIQFTIAGRYYSIKDSSGIGIATRLVTTVYNNSGNTITKGSVIYINGRHSSNLPTIALAQANTELNSYSTFALVENDILNNNSGTVIQAGNIGNLNLPTATYTDGQLVYLSPTVAGGITTTKPLAPNHIVKIGTITRAHPTFGTIELKIENGWQLDELSDVKIAAVPADSTILQFSRVDSLWHDVSIPTAIGNRYVTNITRTPGKDSIIFYVGSTRYAIKDSVGGGGGGTPGGVNGSIQFKNNSSFAGDEGLKFKGIYKNAYAPSGAEKGVLIGGTTADSAQNKFEVVRGTYPNNTMMYRGVYEMASFTNSTISKLGIYGSGDYSYGGGSVIFGNIGYTNANDRFPGFEMQNANDEGNPDNSALAFHYTERDIDGQVQAADLNLLKINANGLVQVNGFGVAGLSANPRLVVGEDNNGATLETSGDCYIGNGLNVNNGLTSNGNATINGTLITNGAINRHILYTDDSESSEFYPGNTEHIIIFSTGVDNATIYLPDTPDDGRELIIKQVGNVGAYRLYIDGNGNDILYDDATVTSLQINDTGSHSIKIVYHDTVWYVLNY